MKKLTTKSKVQAVSQLDKVTIGYARVSSLDDRQKLGLEVQTNALADCDVIFSEKQSGSNDERPELAKAIELAKELTSQGKEVSLNIYKLDRLTRSMSKLGALLDEFSQHTIKLVSLQENLETDSLTGRLLCIVLGYVAEIELENIRQRTRAGLAQAKANGKVLGNPPLSNKIEQEVLHLYQLNSIPIKTIAKRLKISESSVYKVARKHGVSRRK
ncbi:recombinase family protein [Vagococcus allomyrinae]|uniref:recombinase family protein n=1 Tax=Vagococcus allomyrinae TaxID=2794353 RepID=UPI001FD7C188|nr:recombinase family protein [Vagococcus allomyrinae]